MFAQKPASMAVDEQAGSKGSGSVPWIEKYRPKSLDDIAHQEEVVATLRRTMETGNLPHLLFYGPPGTGKTSTILAVARQLYGPDLMKKRVLELNASNERGINAIRTRVKNFAQVAVGSRDNVKGYPCPPYKIIILDEADSMTHDAQAALRRTMETYTKVTRFCIICNYVSRIIEPITSRCAKFRYQPLSAQTMSDKLTQIAAAEEIPGVTSEVLKTLVAVSGGDMRKSITLLQSANRFAGEGQALDLDGIREVAGRVPDGVIAMLLDSCKQHAFQKIQDAAAETVANGFPVDQILSQFLDALVEDKAIIGYHKSLIAIRMAEADKKLNDGADEYLQLMDVLSYASTTLTGPSKPE